LSSETNVWQSIRPIYLSRPSRLAGNVKLLFAGGRYRADFR